MPFRAGGVLYSFVCLSAFEGAAEAFRPAPLLTIWQGIREGPPQFAASHEVVYRAYTRSPSANNNILEYIRFNVNISYVSLK